MNPKIEALPRWKNFPIPFFVTYTKDGTPDFKVINEQNRKRCAEEKLCWICGTPLDYWVVFIGGPLSAKNRLFTDGPMHEECARDALSICPFLLGSMDYAPDSSFRWDKFDESVKVRDYSHMSSRTTPPEQNCLFKTRGFIIGVNPEHTAWFFWAKPAINITWFKRGEPPK